MELNSLHDVYVHELKDIYSAEKQVIEALPKMVRAAQNEELQTAFSSHLDQSKNHLDRVSRILESLEVNPGSTVCDGMKGLISEGESLIKNCGSQDAKDAALIAAAQRVEHYEMAAYGCARTYARALGYHDQADLLQKILDEEGDTDKKLTSLAEGSFFREGINEAAQG